MNARLAAKLIRYHIEYVTESAGSRRHRGTSDVWLLCAVLLSVSACTGALWR